VAYFVGTAFLIAGIGFYFLSQAYFDSRAEDGITYSAAHILDVRIAFGVMLACITAGGMLAAYAPRAVGHGLAAAAGVLAFVGGVSTMVADINFVLPVALFLTGSLFLILTWKSLEGSRAAWAFLVAMCAVFAVVMLFGSTKVRSHTGVGLYYAMIIPGLLAVATLALALVRGDYRDR
jgi:hypothetical protein